MAGEAGLSGLGPKPLEALTTASGTWALNFLVLTLAVSPAARLSGREELVRYRRLLGLSSFGYALLHLATYVFLDKALAWGKMAQDLPKRPFILAGLGAFLCLLPLAATSSDSMMRRLGPAWGRLHRLAYPAAILAAVHLLWMARAPRPKPMAYALCVALLLGLRLFRRED